MCHVDHRVIVLATDLHEFLLRKNIILRHPKMELELKKYRPELWEVLAFAGLWSVTAKANLEEDFNTPQDNEVYLLGVPFVDKNVGVNQDLRLINFAAPSTLNGPVSLTGLQTTFFNNYLNHTVRWCIDPIGKCEETVKIGFYSTYYLSGDANPGSALPILTSVGPAFFETTKCNRKGSFDMSLFGDMYIVVDANVSVKLYISVKVPTKFVEPDLTVLYKPYKYFVKDGCGEKAVVATEQLIDERTLRTFLRPTNPYINTSEYMKAYLLSKRVIISLMGNRSRKTYHYDSIPFVRLQGSMYEMNTAKLTFCGCGNRCVACNKAVSTNLDASFTLVAKLADSTGFSLKLTPILGYFSANRWQPIPGLSLGTVSLLPGKEISVKFDVKQTTPPQCCVAFRMMVEIVSNRTDITDRVIQGRLEMSLKNLDILYYDTSVVA